MKTKEVFIEAEMPYDDIDSEMVEIRKSYLRGHKIEFLNDEWVFSDTKDPTDSTYEGKPCGHCDLYQTREGHDGCLGTLNGIMNACCGHGRANESYVQFLDGHCIHGEDASIVLDILKKSGLSIKK